jgi:hypothetical protein
VSVCAAHTHAHTHTHDLDVPLRLRLLADLCVWITLCSILTSYRVHQASETIKITVFAKTYIKLAAVVRLEVEEGLDHFIVLHVETEPSKFGVDPQGLEMTKDHGFTVPSVLHVLRHCFVDNGGLKTPDVRRSKNSAASLLIHARCRCCLCSRMSKVCGSSSNHCRGTHLLVVVMLPASWLPSRCVRQSVRLDACKPTRILLVQAWYRELPHRVLDEIKPKDLLGSEKMSPALCEALLQRLPSVEKQLFMWIVDLLADLVVHTDEKTDIKRLGMWCFPVTCSKAPPSLLLSISLFLCVLCLFQSL